MVNCFFCPLPSHGACAWPVDQYVESEASQLEPGDMVRRHTDKETEADRYYRMKIREVSKIKDDLLRIVVIIKARDGQPYAELQTFEANTFSRIRILRKAPCGQQACERHVIIRGPGVYLCATHWNDWQVVK